MIAITNDTLTSVTDKVSNVYAENVSYYNLYQHNNQDFLIIGLFKSIEIFKNKISIIFEHTLCVSALLADISYRPLVSSTVFLQSISSNSLEFLQ